MTITEEIERRRSFAIIAHPDAGKTTLTEKLLLFGGAIATAGAVRAKKENAHTRSDWMELERARGISVVTSVMTFEYKNHIFNLLDTPGHEDFADDTYRTLSAVDSAIMVIDAAKGIEARTLKLFEVCRMRDIPIMIFVNKMDREALHPIELMDEIENKLALEVAPINLPLGQGQNFKAIYNIEHNYILTSDKAAKEYINAEEAKDVAKAKNLDNFAQDIWKEVLELSTIAPRFNLQAYRQGYQAPIYFGSALKDIGVIELINDLALYGPPPGVAKARTRDVAPDETKLSGFIFKIQANMDPNHRSSLAFMRICSGILRRNMRLNIVNSGGKSLNLSAPQFFFGARRNLVEQAFPGDVVGIANNGYLSIGTSLGEDENIEFLGVPVFAPQILRKCRMSNALKAKNLNEALTALAQEGAVQLFIPLDGSALIIGVVGALQLDVLKMRLQSEYNLDVNFEASRFNLCRWITGANSQNFIKNYPHEVAHDSKGNLVFLAANQFELNYALEHASEGIEFLDVKQ